MSKGMLIMFAASLLSLGACGADVADELDSESEATELEHRWGGNSRCDDDDADSDEGAGNGGGAEASKREGGRRRRWNGCAGKRDGGATTRPDAGAPTGGRDAGTRPTPPTTPPTPPTTPTPTRDAGGPVVTRDAGVTAPPTTRDAGGPVVNPGDGDGPGIVDVDRDVITLPDGSVVRIDRSCPNYATPFAVTLPGCCLPAGSCGLSTHELDVAGVPKGCFSYDQAKMLDPSFSMPAKSCSAN